jgi:hypothetical protein
MKPWRHNQSPAVPLRESAFSSRDESSSLIVTCTRGYADNVRSRNWSCGPTSFPPRPERRGLSEDFGDVIYDVLHDSTTRPWAGVKGLLCASSNVPFLQREPARDGGGTRGGLRPGSRGCQPAAGARAGPPGGAAWQVAIPPQTSQVLLKSAPSPPWRLCVVFGSNNMPAGS